MKNKLTILMLLISFAAIGQEGYNPYAIFGTTDTFDIEAAHKAKAEKEKQEKENLFYLFNADTTATMQILAFDFVNGKVYAYNANEELLGTLYYFEYGDAAFLSTDPHWYNYAHLSPYHYCSNNPIMKIDPTGMDEWEINSKGKIVSHCETTEHDAFYMVDKKGNRIAGKEQVFKYGTVKYLLKHGTLYNIQGDEIYKLKMPKGYKIDWQSWGDES